MPEIGWEDFDVEVEEVSEADAEKIEKGNEGFLGKCIAVVTKTSPKQLDFKASAYRDTAYSCIGILIEYEIEKVLEIGIKQSSEKPKDALDYVVVYEKASANESAQWEGDKIFDEVALFNEAEAEGMAIRRKRIALKLGLIEPGGVIQKKMWQSDIIGKRVIIKTEENRYTDKNNVPKVGKPRIGRYDGYEKIEDQAAGGEAWEDI